MSKSTTQIIAEMRHGLSLLEAINDCPVGNAKKDNTAYIKKENSRLKEKISTLNRSNGQFMGIAERKTKQVLRLQTENEELRALVKSLKQAIILIESAMDRTVTVESSPVTFLVPTPDYNPR